MDRYVNRYFDRQTDRQIDRQMGTWWTYLRLPEQRQGVISGASSPLMINYFVINKYLLALQKYLQMIENKYEDFEELLEV